MVHLQFGKTAGYGITPVAYWSLRPCKESLVLWVSTRGGFPKVQVLDGHVFPFGLFSPVPAVQLVQCFLGIIESCELGKFLLNPGQEGTPNLPNPLRINLLISRVVSRDVQGSSCLTATFAGVPIDVPLSGSPYVLKDQYMLSVGQGHCSLSAAWAIGRDMARIMLRQFSSFWSVPGLLVVLDETVPFSGALARAVSFGDQQVQRVRDLGCHPQHVSLPVEQADTVLTGQGEYLVHDLVELA